MEKRLLSQQTRGAYQLEVRRRGCALAFEVAYQTYLDAYTSITSCGVIRMVVQPNQVADPVRVRVARDHDVVVDIVIVESLKRAVAVSLVPIPCVVIQRINISISNGLVNAREDGLGPDDTPCSCPLLRGDELAIEPILLPTTHHGTACVV